MWVRDSWRVDDIHGDIIFHKMIFIIDNRHLILILTHPCINNTFTIITRTILTINNILIEIDLTYYLAQ